MKTRVDPILRLAAMRNPIPPLLSSAVVLLACAWSNGGIAAAAGVQSLSPPALVGAQPTAADADYRIGPLDVLEVTARYLPEMNATTVRVSANGQITLPLVGDIAAEGRSAMQLQRDIAHRLEEYVKNPDVTIFIKEYASQRVTVEGEVNQPGIFPIEGRTTLLQAVALAHGTNQIALLQRVVVYRSVNGLRVATVFDLAAIRLGKQPDPEVYGSDVVEVNASRARAVFRNILSAVPLATLIRPY
jgi:polysaccharide export outer membrane protein